MSLFFKERIEEQTDDLSNDTITFIHNWILEIERTFEFDDDTYFHGYLRTTYDAFTESWSLYLSRDAFHITSFSNDEYDEYDEPIGPCFFAYKLFYDDDMRFEYYSSKRVYAVWVSTSSSFLAPYNFLTKLFDAIDERRISKIVMNIEFVLPKKYLSYPYDIPSSNLNQAKCVGYPKDMETDFRFQFLKQSDYAIECPDGTMPALRSNLNLSSTLMQKHFKKFQDADKLIVGHSIDVIKPLVLYLHSRCFEMAKSYTLDFADQLLKAIQYFKVFQGYGIRASIQLSLCHKFVEETHDFISLLRWLSIAYQHNLGYLERMICVVIATKYFYKWHETFPENARNAQNPLYRDIFGLSNSAFQTFRAIEVIFYDSFFTKAILD